MIEIFIEDYLKEAKLRDILIKIIGKENFFYDTFLGEMKVPYSRKRWDMGFKYKNQIYVVEFDGDQHYRNPIIIKSDNEKDKIAKELGYITIRIPYFIQLNDETFLYYFPFYKEKEDFIIYQNYPHGFIDKKAMLPASFCKLGLEKYHKELSKLPDYIRKEINISLENQCKDLDPKYVY